MNSFSPQLAGYVKQNYAVYSVYKKSYTEMRICGNCGFPESAHNHSDNCVLYYFDHGCFYSETETFKEDKKLTKVFWIYMRLMGINFYE
jgi:hypothetical protein